MVDPRLSILNKRLAKVKKIIAVSSGKGGVGKSLIASTLALILSKMGRRVGLLDLDFTGPSTHVILNTEGHSPREEEGVIPPEAHGMKYMSIVYYTRDQPTPMRGEDMSNAIIELFAITQWEDLDFLIVDMPPGIADATLDMIRLIERISFLIVTTPSKLAFETVEKLILLLKDLKIPIVGIVENMKMKESNFIREKAEEQNIPYLGEIGFDPRVEDSIGDVDKLLQTEFAQNVRETASNAPQLKT